MEAKHLPKNIQDRIVHTVYLKGEVNYNVYVGHDFRSGKFGLGHYVHEDTFMLDLQTKEFFDFATKSNSIVYNGLEYLPVLCNKIGSHKSLYQCFLELL